MVDSPSSGVPGGLLPVTSAGEARNTPHADICLFPCSFECSRATRVRERRHRRRDLLEGPEITFAEAVLDNGRFGTRTVRFET